MAANTPTCAQCGGPLAPVPHKPGRRACSACGHRFSARDRTADAPAPAGGDPRLRTALLVGGVGAVVLLGLIAAVAFVVAHPAGGAAPPKPVAAALSTPAPDPAPDPRPTLPPAPAPIATPPPPPAPAVKKAIDKGVAYLKTAVNDVRLGPGTLASIGVRGTGIFSLVGLALLESGVPADDPAVVKAVAAARSGAATNSTYEIAVCLWLLNRLDDRRDDGLMRDLATRLLAGQDQSGAWDYLCPTVAPAKQEELLTILTTHDPSQEIPAPQQLIPSCAYRRGLSLQTDAGDNSATQFAVLGLWVARKHQVPVDRALLMAEAHARATQKDEGGWAYRPGRYQPTDGMTCAGLMELAVGRGVSVTEGGKARQADPQFEKGIWFLSDIYGRGVAAAAATSVPTAAAYATLQPLATDLLGHALQGQREAWKKDLAAFQAELERCLAADPPADAKKDLQQIADQIKQYHDAPGDQVTQEKAALVKRIQQSPAGRPAPAPAARPGMAPEPYHHFLLPNRAQALNDDDIYALWSLERLAMVCDLKTLAGHDWYAWGADLLVTHQRDDGGWADAWLDNPALDPVDACLALLFLNRVNVAQDLTAQLQHIAPVLDLTADQLHYTSADQFRQAGPTAPPKPSGP